MALPNNSQALAWQAEGSMGDAAWAPSAPQAPVREEGDELWVRGRHPRGQAEPAATAIMGKPGAKGHAARGSAADPVCGMLCAKCEMPLHMKQTPAGRVLSHPRTTHTTTREWVFYLPIRTFSLN